MKPTLGRTVHYSLSEADVARIGHQRALRVDVPGDNRAVHHGNRPEVGELVPLVIVRVWPDEYGPGVPGVNGQAFLDGNDALWVTSAAQGTDPGTWRWPERV